jgi:hypothetical protein
MSGPGHKVTRRRLGTGREPGLAVALAPHAPTRTFNGGIGAQPERDARNGWERWHYGPPLQRLGPRVQPLHSCRPVKTTRAESLPGLIPASQQRAWTFPRWTVRWWCVSAGRRTGSTAPVNAPRRCSGHRTPALRERRQRPPGPPRVLLSHGCDSEVGAWQDCRMSSWLLHKPSTRPSDRF